MEASTDSNLCGVPEEHNPCYDPDMDPEDRNCAKNRAAFADDSEVDDGPELALNDIDGGPVVLELDHSPPPARATPTPPLRVEPQSEPAPSRLAAVGESLRSDWGRLLITGAKAATWLGLGMWVLNRPGVLAAIVAGALAGDIAIWFVIRVLELPRHIWAFQIEALVNLLVVWALVDVMHLFEAFRQPDLLPFGVTAFFLVGLGRFTAYWLPRVLAS